MPSSSTERSGVPILAIRRIGRRQNREARKTMSGDLDKRGEGAETLGQKIDTLAASVDHRLDALSASVDQRFDAFAASVDERFATLSASVDERFDAVDAALIEQRQYTEFAFDRVDKRFDRVDGRLDRIDSRFDRLERKLDQFIDTQSATNKLVERRLTALEPRSAHE
jgi:DNA anti-recombination protein RmuC